jgi:hypothetical protein
MSSTTRSVASFGQRSRQSLDEAENHLHALHANPDGYGISAYRPGQGVDAVTQGLIARAAR